MQGRTANLFSRLLAVSLIMLALSAPAYAVDFRAEVVNRTGHSQMGVVVMLDDVVMIDSWTSDRFAQMEILRTQGFPLVTLVHFFNADGIGRAIPSSMRANPPAASVVRIAFSSPADHFFVLALYWVDASGNVTPITLP